jgi:hypothetical protein
VDYFRPARRVQAAGGGTGPEISPGRFVKFA